MITVNMGLHLIVLSYVNIISNVSLKDRERYHNKPQRHLRFYPTALHYRLVHHYHDGQNLHAHDPHDGRHFPA